MGIARCGQPGGGMSQEQAWGPFQAGLGGAALHSGVVHGQPTAGMGGLELHAGHMVMAAAPPPAQTAGRCQAVLKVSLVL